MIPGCGSHPGIIAAFCHDEVEMRVMSSPRSPTCTLPSLSEINGEKSTVSPPDVIETVTSGKMSLTLQPMTNASPFVCS